MHRPIGRDDKVRRMLDSRNQTGAHWKTAPPLTDLRERPAYHPLMPGYLSTSLRILRVLSPPLHPQHPTEDFLLKALEKALSKKWKLTTSWFPDIFGTTKNVWTFFLTKHDTFSKILICNTR
jgi:hypothetical protein